MSEQARALALAAQLKESTNQAAAELRRLHGVNAQLLEALQLSVHLLRKYADLSNTGKAVRFDLSDWREAAPIFAAIAKAKAKAKAKGGQA